MDPDLDVFQIMGLERAELNKHMSISELEASLLNSKRTIVRSRIETEQINANLITLATNYVREIGGIVVETAPDEVPSFLFPENGHLYLEYKKKLEEEFSKLAHDSLTRAREAFKLGLDYTIAAMAKSSVWPIAPIKPDAKGNFIFMKLGLRPYVVGVNVDGQDSRMICSRREKSFDEETFKMLFEDMKSANLFAGYCPVRNAFIGNSVLYLNSQCMGYVDRERALATAVQKAVANDVRLN